MKNNRFQLNNKNTKLNMIPKLLSKRIYRWLFSILSGILLVVSFPNTGSFYPLIFIAFVPLLLIENYLTGNKNSSLFVFAHAYLAFFIYNLGVTWWVYNSSVEGGLMAFFANSLLMALAFLVYHRINKKIGAKWRVLLFASIWLSFEFFHFRWELSWPWLTVGNVFANSPILIQWYSITGVLGGSLWILIVNGLFSKFLISSNVGVFKKNSLQKIAFILILPVLISLALFYTKSTSGKPFRVLLLQPNVDPFSKFSTSSEQQLNSLLSQIDHSISSKTELIVAPETSLLPGYAFDEDRIDKEIVSHLFREKRAAWNNADLLIGATTQRLFNSKHSHVSKYIPQMNAYYETYNSSLLFSERAKVNVVHKSKLVLGVEKIPFSSIFPFLENLAIDLGGSSGTLGIEKESKVLNTKGVSFSPSVCYESIYGEFVAKQTKKGAQFIAIITNDGWWGNSPGHRQHFALARLRAIENNKYVIRSANTGISGVINNRGEVVSKTEYWKKDQINATIFLNSSKTIYQYFGDLIGYFALVGAVVFYAMRWLGKAK